MSQAGGLAEEFLVEYLGRSIDIIDVAEFVSDNAPVDDDLLDNLIDAVYDIATAELDTVLQRYLDKDS